MSNAPRIIKPKNDEIPQDLEDLIAIVETAAPIESHP